MEFIEFLRHVCSYIFSDLENFQPFIIPIVFFPFLFSPRTSFQNVYVSMFHDSAHIPRAQFTFLHFLYFLVLRLDNFSFLPISHGLFILPAQVF